MQCQHKNKNYLIEMLRQRKNAIGEFPSKAGDSQELGTFRKRIKSKQAIWIKVRNCIYAQVHCTNKKKSAGSNMFFVWSFVKVAFLFVCFFLQFSFFQNLSLSNRMLKPSSTKKLTQFFTQIQSCIKQVLGQMIYVLSVTINLNH